MATRVHLEVPSVDDRIRHASFNGMDDEHHEYEPRHERNPAGLEGEGRGRKGRKNHSDDRDVRAEEDERMTESRN